MEKIARDGWYKWLWNPHNNQYQEWQGDMSHPEVAQMLWRGQPNWEDFSDWWGGTRHEDGHVDIGWHPMEYDHIEAKKNAPLELLQHLQRRQNM